MVHKSTIYQQGTGGVSSINGETGAVSLTSTGGTITITPVGSNINLEAVGGGGGAVNSVTAGDSSLTISPTTGAVVASVNQSALVITESQVTNLVSDLASKQSTTGTPNTIEYYNGAGTHTSSTNLQYDGTKQTIETDGIGVTVTDALLFQNATPATNGNQQAPGAIHFSGQAFAVTPATSQGTDMRGYLLPVQGASTLASWVFHIQSSVNGSAFADILTLGSSGQLQAWGSITGGAASSATVAFGAPGSSNFSSVSSNVATINNALYNWAGVTTTSYRNLFGGSINTVAVTANTNYGANIFGAAGTLSATTGTHPFFANVVIRPIGTVTAGGAAITNSASLFIEAAAAVGTNNYAIYSAAGNNRFVGTVTNDVLTSGGIVKAATGGALALAVAGTDYQAVGGPIAFNTLTTGTNITATMTVGSGATLTHSGTGSIAATTVSITDDTTTAADMPINWVTTNTGDLPVKVTSTKFTFNPSTANLRVVGGTVSAGIVTTSTVGGNLYTPSSGGISGTNTAAMQFAGSTNLSQRVTVYGSVSTTTATGNNYSAFQVASSPVTTPSATSNPWFAQQVVNKFGTVTLTGGATVTNATLLYLAASPTFAGTNYCMYAEDGLVHLGGSLEVIGTTKLGTLNGILKGTTGIVGTATAGTDYQAPISLTTTGTSGAATFVSNVLNIPNYSTSGSAVTNRQVFVSGTDFTPGTSTTLTLTASPLPTNAASILIFDDAGNQQSTEWSYTSPTITFTAAIPVGVRQIEVVWGATTGTSFVPYSGATSNVALGTNSLTAQTVDSTGGLGASIVTKTTAYTATASDFTILADATSGALTITLPIITRRLFNVKKIDATANVVTVKTATGNIDGVAGTTGKSISSQYVNLQFQCDGTNMWTL